MERLKTLYKSEQLKVLVAGETELLLLLGNRHVKYEKTDLAFLNGLKFTTTQRELTPQDVAAIVRDSYHPFYSTDIERILIHHSYFEVVVKHDVYLHRGSFKIYKE